MDELIIDCYSDLKYDDIDNTEVESKILHLLAQLKFDKNDNFSKRFLDTASVIKKNITLFLSISDHVDKTTSVIDCLNYFGAKFMFYPWLEYKEDKILSIMFTLCNIPTNSFIRESLAETILKNSKLEHAKCNLYNHWPCRNFEMVVLEDSDIYVALKEVDDFCNIRKIWVQEAIVPTFMRIVQDLYYHLYNYVHIFRSKQELIASCTSVKMHIVSIWSEDIVAAKNLATLLNGDIVFINTCMDFREGIVLLPYSTCEDLNLSSDESSNLNEVSIINKRDSEIEYLIYNFFYDGMWQKPVENTYVTYNEYLWANATKSDFKKCTISAQKGAKIWSTKPINSKLQILSKLASTLEYNGKCQLANMISKWIKFPYHCEELLTYPHSGKLEVTTIHKPRGVIILKGGESLTSLFWRLILALIAGNSVIVFCTSISCTLAPYCDMFSTSGIPPGVINMLSLNDVLRIKDYCVKEDELYPENDPVTTYLNLTIPKQIVLPLK